MPEFQKKSIFAIDLFDLPLLCLIRRFWFKLRVRGAWGSEARTLFFLDMAEAARHGIPLDLALELTAGNREDTFSTILMRLDQTVEMIAFYLLPYVRQGLTLSEAMRRLGGVFSPQEIQIVAMGESMGFLPRALKRLANFRQTTLRLRRVGRYLKYPFALFCIATLLISFLMIFIIPKYQDLLAMLGGNMPLLTRMLISATSLILTHLPVLWVLLALLVLIFFLNRSVTRSSGFPLFYHLPILNELYRSIADALWMAAFTLGLESGAPAHLALTMAGTIGGGKLAQRSAAAAALVEQGAPIGEACLRCGVLQNWINHRLQLIDWRGNYIQEIHGIVQDADRRVSDSLERFGRRLEIISNVAAGLIIGFTVIAIYLPLFEIPRLIEFTFV